MKKLFQKERCFHLCDRRLDEILLRRFQPDANFLIEKSLISAKEIFSQCILQERL